MAPAIFSPDNIKRLIIKYLCFSILSIVIISPIYAQPAAEKPARILFLLDGSSSMTNEWNASQNRFEAAANVIAAIADSIHKINEDVEFALRVFGHQDGVDRKNCYDTRLEVGFGIQNVEQIQTRLRYISPQGVSPIAWSLKETALEDFRESNKYAYSIILLTDGGESCGGDICATVTAMLNRKISFKPYILSMVDYAPLKAQYDCLGKYLTVAKEADIVPAIKTIIDDNRKILSIKSNYVRINTKTAPPVASTIDMRPRISISSGNEPVKESVPEKKSPVKDTLPLTPVVATPTPVNVPESTGSPKVVILKSLTTGTSKKMNILYALAAANPIRVKPLPVFKNLIPQEAVIGARPPEQKPRPETPRTPPPPSEVVVKSEPSKESSVKIYFTNGAGKFYTTEPDMIIADAKTSKQIVRTFRNVGANGEPEPIMLPPGNYSLAIPGSTTNVPSFSISPSETKKLEIVVTNSTLAFEYPTNKKKPVTEYTALVSKRFDAGPVVKQRCDERLPYEPANYHIEVNTLPPTLRNTDLSFGALTVVAIDEPGTIVINNTNNVGRVEFWYPLGDSYLRFYEMNVAGDPSFQKADFRPGPYQARYIKASTGQVEVIPFKIKSNETTLLNLQP